MATVDEAAIEQREARASAMVAALCEPRGTAGAREWTMSIPARPDRDPDLVISAALADIPALLAALRDVRAALELATARYRVAEAMLLDNMPEDWLARATGHQTFDVLWATDSEFVESMRLEARAALVGATEE